MTPCRFWRLGAPVCTHAWLVGYLYSWLQGRGVEVVEDLVDFDAGELVLVGECLLDGCDGVLVFCQDLFVGLDGVGDEVTWVEWSGVAVGAPAYSRKDNSFSKSTVNVYPGAVNLTAIENILREARQVALDVVPDDFGGPWARQWDKRLVVTPPGPGACVC